MNLNLRWACLPVALLAVPGASSAQPSDSSVARFNECAVIKDNGERLACFDRVTREVRANVQPTAPRSTTPGSPPQTKEAQLRKEREDFGLTAERVREKRAEPAKIARLTAKVAATRKFGAGYWVLMLDDGAIWELTELRLAFQPPKRGETIHIRRGVMDGYLLYVGQQSSIRVRRIS